MKTDIIASLYSSYKKNIYTSNEFIIKVMIVAEFFTPDQIVAPLDQDTRVKLKEWVEETPEKDGMVLSSGSMDVIRAEDIRKMKAYFKEHPEG